MTMAADQTSTLTMKGAPERADLQLPEGFPLYELPDEAAAIEALDPVTYEVIRHRIQRIDEEQANAIARVSGSQVVSAAQDFNVVVADEIGNVVAVGTHVLWHGVILDMLIKAVLEARAGDVGIHEGDMFLVNDPFLGAGHYNDVAILSPLFHEGRLVSWTGSMLHQLDVGGNAFGSLCTAAVDAFDEPRPFPPVKICEGGRIRNDILGIWLSHSRLPEYLELDLRAQVAGNNVAARRIAEVIEDYGIETYATVLKKMIAEADTRFRERLRRLPDGRWRHVEYIDKSREGDDRIHKAVLTLEKRGDHLTFDTTGTDAQIGILSCSHGGFRAGTMFPILQYVCHDMPWASSGMLRNISYISEPGTILHAERGALVSCAGASGIYTSMNLAQQCVSKMLLSSEEHRDEAVAMNMASWTLMMLSGESQHGAPFLGFLMDPMAGAVGARPNKDGVDTGGIIHSPQSSQPEVELYEQQYPILYLYRREEPDMGGAGRWRGGTSLGMAYMPHDAPVPITTQTLAHGVAFPTNLGLSGGYPGGTIRYQMQRGSRAADVFAGGRIPTSPEEVGGTEDVLDFKGLSEQGPDDVLFVRTSSSGGYGDPLEREPERVAADVLAGYVTVATAARIYGVVLDGADVDAARTEETRKRILDERRSRSRAGEGDWAWHSE
jgi:N-methylhydantoinase B